MIAACVKQKGQADETLDARGFAFGH